MDLEIPSPPRTSPMSDKYMFRNCSRTVATYSMRSFSDIQEPLKMKSKRYLESRVETVRDG